MARQIAPDLEIHGSTQMSITSADGVRLAQSFGVSARHAGARTVAGRGPRHPRSDRLRAGDLRPWRAVRGVFRPVLLVRGVGRAQRQSRPVRAGLPAAVRDDRGRQAASRWATRATCFRRAISTRCAQVPEIVRHRHLGAEDRRPLQGCGLRGADHARLPPGGGRGLGGPAARASIAAPNCNWSRSTRAASGRSS